MSDFLTEELVRHFRLDETYSSDNCLGWLKHRLGIERYKGAKNEYNTKALDLNESSNEFLDTYGDRTVSGYVGFIDLIGFSDATQGMLPSAIKEYISPFINGILSAAGNNDVLIDKTIGDEVMFFIPDRTKDWKALPPTMCIHYFMADIQKLYGQLEGKYPFRFGIAYGDIYIGLVEGKSYSEWTLFGETVNLAKRLQGLPQLKQNDGVWKVSGAFGTLKTQSLEPSSFEALLCYATGHLDRFKSTNIESPPQLKGISDYECAIISPVSPIQMI